MLATPPGGLRCLLLVSSVLLLPLAVGVPAAFAGVGLGVTPTSPPVVGIGQTGVPASLQIQNVSTPPESGGNLTVNTIDLVPACGSGTALPGSGDCPAGSADPGVLGLSATAVGEPGTACAGINFNVAVINSTTGQASFTPVGGPVVLTPPGTMNSVCRLDFTFQVLGAPAHPASMPGPNSYQTIMLAHVTATSNPTGLPSGDQNGTTPVTINKAQPSGTTTATQSARVGGTISDTAHLVAASPPVPPPTGTLTFTGFNNPTCTGPPVFTSTLAVSGGGDYPSVPFTPNSAGTYSWVVSYSGDANNAAFTSGCGDAGEVSTVTKAAPTITTTASAGVPAGGMISDTGTLAGGSSPTGTITFTAFGPNNATCTGAPLGTSTVTVTGNGTYLSGPFTTPGPGTYDFVVSYSGDAANAAAVSGCGAAGESVILPRPVIGVTKVASPLTEIAPGGTFTFTVRVSNPSAADPITITSLIDDIYGNIAARPGSTCGSLIGVTLAPGAVSSPCSFTGPFSGRAGDSETDTVTVDGVDANRFTATAVAHATVSLVAGIPQIAVTKAASPLSLVEPGGTFTFTVQVSNPSTSVPVTITALTDNVYGNIATRTGSTCGALIGLVLPPGGESPACSFTGGFTGRAGASQTDTVTVTGVNDGIAVTATAMASVTLTPAPAPAPQIAVTKVATPLSRVEPGGTFTFTVQVSNPSPIDPISITSVTDNIYGNLATRPGSTCGGLIGVTLAPGATSAPCSFTGVFAGTAGASQTDTVTVAGFDSFGTTATNTARATVTLTPALPQIAVTKTAAPLTRPQPGGTFTFTVQVSNPGASAPITITSLTDNVYGNLATRPGSTCGALIGVVLPPGATSAPCSFTGPFTGRAGDSQTDTVTVTGVNNGTAVTATAQATVRLVGGALAIATHVAPATTTVGSSFQDVATLGPPPPPPGGVAPTGSVTFKVYGPDNATCTGTPALSSTNPVSTGGASATSGTFTPDTAGTYRVVASYSGDANYLGSTTACGDPGETVVVTRAPTTTTVSVAPGSPTFGQSVTYTATVAPVPPAGGTPTGTVTFAVDGKILGTRPLSPAGTASISTGPLPAGSHTVTASYSGDGTFLPSTGTRTFSSTCAVTIAGVHSGALAVRSSVCLAPGAEVTGAIIVHDGGSLEVESARIDGSILANGVSGAIRICGSSVGGALDIKNSTGPVTVGSSDDASCAPNQIGGALIVKDDTGGVDVGGNATGAVIVKGNSGPPPFSGVGTNAAVTPANPGAASTTTGSVGDPGGVGQTLGRACGTAHLGAGEPLSKLPLFAIIVSSGPTGCATARSVLAHFTHHIVKHAKVMGFSCARIPVTGLARCVKATTTITDKLLRP